MSSQVSSFADTHSEIVLLLPWYVNQSLPADERQHVEKHLKSCLICRRELLNLRKLSTAVQRSTDLEVAAEASFAGLRAKMQQAGQSRPMPSMALDKAGAWPGKLEQPGGGWFGQRRRFWKGAGNAGKGLAIAASVLLVALPMAMKYLPLSAGGDYYTLANAKPDANFAGQLRVVFAKQLPENAIDSLLSQIDAVRVDGPNSAGAYTVRLTNGTLDRDQALALLRGRQDVILAEPIVQP